MTGRETAGVSLGSAEHYGLMEAFEREYSHRRLDRESRAAWPRCIVYQDGGVNELFLAYRRGYVLGKYAAGSPSEGRATTEGSDA